MLGFNNTTKIFSLIILIGFIFVIGVYVGAQGTTPTVWHSLQSIVKSATNVVSVDANSDGIIDSAETLSMNVTNLVVAANASIFSSKINGSNGWYFVTGKITSTNSWLSVAATANFGVTNWVGKLVEMTCMPGSGEIIVASGMFPFNIYRHNQKIFTFNLGTQTEIYRASDTSSWPTGSQYQTLEVSVDPANTSQLRFRRFWVPGSVIGANVCPASPATPCEPQYTDFECVVKLIA